MVREASRLHVLDDGLDQEGSIPYHILVLEMFLVARIAGGEELADIDGTLRAMMEAAAAVTAFDGWIPDLGDDDGGRVLALSDFPSRDGRRVVALGEAVLGERFLPECIDEALFDDARWLVGLESRPQGARPEPTRDVSPRFFSAGGILVLGNRVEHIVVDVGPVGFRGRGGHGHVDATSIIARFGRDVVIRDSGTGSYTGDAQLRERLRDASAHSVVVVDHQQYARIGGTHRLWAIDGDSPPEVIALRGDARVQQLTLRQRLPASTGWATLERRLEWQPGHLSWHDVVDAPRGSTVRHYIQLPDGCELHGRNIIGPHATYVLNHVPAGARAHIEPVETSARYGSVTKEPRVTIEYESSGPAGHVALEVCRR